MRFFTPFFLILINFSAYSQGFAVACFRDTIRGNHGGLENDAGFTFCAYNTNSSSNILPKMVLETNDSIINQFFLEFFSNNNVLIRDYLLIENEKFQEMKSNEKRWISIEHCSKEVKYAIRYQIWIYDNIRYFFSINYDSSYNCLNLSAIQNLCKDFNKHKLLDFCTIKEKADKDVLYRGKVKEVTFSYNNKQLMWIFEKDGKLSNKKNLKGYDYILTYNAYTGKLIKRSKNHFESCEPCPAFYD